ncbi:MAG: stage III sporulation protein AE [Firmicutes bacterium]|nr:stage III sporulation protein AE [Bacillota bacterium]
MSKLLLIVILVFSLAVPVSAAELAAPTVPPSGAEVMPEKTDSFGEGLLHLLEGALLQLRPDLKEATKVSLGVIAAVMMVSLLQSFSGGVKTASEFAGTAAIAAGLLLSANSLIRLATETITEISEYGKLLLPVMTAAMAAQGGVTASAALYTGTAVFDAVLSSLISRLLVPMVYLFLALAVANSAVGEAILKNMRDFTKGLVSWCLKILLTVFTTYITVTGVVSGTTDAAALKATKVTISSVVPVVGSILSDASEAVLVSAGLMKNAAGIYGILAVLAVFLQPFLKIGVHYLILKLTAALCALFGEKRLTELIGDFSSAMGLLLAMTGSECLLLLISTVCFLKGVG